MKQILLVSIQLYRRRISPLFPPCCRYRPTCSEYAVQAIQKYGALKGGWMALKRIGRCHPLSKWDWDDPVP